MAKRFARIRAHSLPAVIAYARLCPIAKTCCVPPRGHARRRRTRVPYRSADGGRDEHGDEPVDPRFIERALVMLDHEAEHYGLPAPSFSVVADDSSRPSLRCCARCVSTGELEDEAEAIELWLELKQATHGLVHRGCGRLFHRDPLAWARVALAQLRHPRALQWIDRELRAWNRERRTLAVAMSDGHACTTGGKPSKP